MQIHNAPKNPSPEEHIEITKEQYYTLYPKIYAIQNPKSIINVICLPNAIYENAMDSALNANITQLGIGYQPMYLHQMVNVICMILLSIKDNLLIRSLQTRQSLKCLLQDFVILCLSTQLLHQCNQILKFVNCMLDYPFRFSSLNMHSLEYQHCTKTIPP